MKRLFAVLLCTLLLAGCAAQPPAAAEAGIVGQAVSFGQSYGDCDCQCVSLEGSGYDWKEDQLVLTINWKNHTLQEGTFGADFLLQKRQDNGWVDCPVKDGCFIEIGYLLQAGQTRQEIYRLTEHYELTQAGQYRFGASCNMEKPVQLWLEFAIGEPPQATQPERGGTIYTSVPVQAQYIRTDGFPDGAAYPLVQLIHSREALDRYYEENRQLYYLERRDQVSTDPSIGFLDACDRYDEAFFADNYLALVLLEEGSGSIRHQVTQIHYTTFDQLRISVDRLVPEVGTADMAVWHLLVQIPREHPVEEEENVLLYVDGTLRAGKPPELNEGLFMRERPPKMQVRNGEKTFDVAMGAYFWDYLVGEDTRSCVTADVYHPLYQYGEAFAVTDAAVELLFEEQPDSMTVDCWPEAALTDEAVDSQPLTLQGNTLQLLEGGYIYHVKARWEENGRDYFGTAEYSFYAILQEPHDHTPAQPHTTHCALLADGNVVATVLGDRENWSVTLTGEDARELTEFLMELYYTEGTCRCIAEHSIKTDFGLYEVNLTEGFVREENHQAQLTARELEVLTQIIDRARERAWKEG